MSLSIPGPLPSSLLQAAWLKKINGRSKTLAKSLKRKDNRRESQGREGPGRGGFRWDSFLVLTFTIKSRDSERWGVSPVPPCFFKPLVQACILSYHQCHRSLTTIPPNTQPHWLQLSLQTGQSTTLRAGSLRSNPAPITKLHSPGQATYFCK